MSNSFTTAVGGAILYATIVIMGIVGWGINAVRFFQSDFNPSYKREIIRGLGIVVFPVGAVAGYCDIEDTKPTTEK